MWWVYVLVVFGFCVMSISFGLFMGRFMALASDENLK